MDKLACAAAFVPAHFDYGAFHKTVRGFGIHMAEGGGTVGYLDNVGPPPARGVSVHFVIEYTGRIVQMLPITHACGGLNPADRSTNKPYYGHDVLVSVLGPNWVDPNAVSIQIEIEGFAAKGPNAKQVDAVIKLANELRARIPTLRGAFGHADQTDTKGCPGHTAAIKDMFNAIGGHGLWEDMPVPVPVSSTVPLLITAPQGRRYDVDGKTVLNPTGGAFADRFSPYGVTNGMRAIYGSYAGKPRVMLVTPASSKPVPDPVPPPVDTDAIFNSGVDAAIAAAQTARKGTP